MKDWWEQKLGHQSSLAPLWLQSSADDAPPLHNYRARVRVWQRADGEDGVAGVISVERGEEAPAWQQSLTGRHYNPPRQPLTQSQIRCRRRAKCINCGTEAVSLQVCDVWQGKSSHRKQKRTMTEEKNLTNDSESLLDVSSCQIQHITPTYDQTNVAV